MEHTLRYFRYEHLPDKLQAISKPFAELAEGVLNTSGDSEQKALALQLLLQAKDAAVRSALG